MRLSLVINSLTTGGAERVMTILANLWCEAGHSVSIITFSKVQPFYPLNSKVGLHSLDLSTKNRSVALAPIILLELLRKLRAKLISNDPDYVVSFMDQANMLSLLATVGTGIKVIPSERIAPTRGSISEKPWPLSPILIGLRNFIYRRAHKIVVQTNGALEYFRDRGLTSLHVIPNPVSPPPSVLPTPLEMPTPFILGVGRLVSQKRFDLLLRAFASISKENLAWSLVIAGAGPLLESLVALSKDLGISERVRFLGAVKDPHLVLRNASLFVLTSDYEGFPSALSEAMSMGLPVISTDCNFGPSDIVTNGVDGLLVPTGDLTAISDAIRQCLGDQALRNALAKNATTVTSKFSCDRVLSLWGALFDNPSVFK